MTRKLFYEDSHMREFEAEVLACEPFGEQYKIVLDETAFFPEGGGQYADTGWIGGVRVTDAHEKEGVIFHTAGGPLVPGTKVKGAIDWDERFEKMQQHSGEHIVSGLIHQKFGYDNVGFHLGSDYCTLDFNGPITRDELCGIETMANEAVFRNLDIQVSYPSKKELESIDYRSKIEIEGQVRIVTVPGYDVCACCAPHMGKTGEIGLIKLTDMVNYKGGERISMLCGFRALRDYRQKECNVKAISALLCAREEETAEAVGHLKEEQVRQKGKIASLQQKMLTYKAAEISTDGAVAAVFDPELSGNGPRELMNLLLDRGARVCAVLAGTDEEGYRYVIGSRTEDVRQLCRELNDRFSGKGGGKPEMVQGSLVGKASEIRRFLEEAQP